MIDSDDETGINSYEIVIDSDDESGINSDEIEGINSDEYQNQVYEFLSMFLND